MARARLVFFSMPFGVKDVAGKAHDFDETWRRLLKPAVPEGWQAVRLDEGNQPGSLPDQFKHYLRVADVGVFDLTAANPSVLYELGIRDVFAPGRRVLVAREDEPLPFNLRNDVNWNLSANEKSERFDEFLKFAGSVFKDDFRTIYPEVKWDFNIMKPRPQPHRILSVHKAADEGVVFVGFNSCVVEDEKEHFGAIGQEQVELARQQLANVDPSWLRIAVLHHHVLPLERQLSLGTEGVSLDATIVRDFAVLETGLHQLGFDMVLHGHKHDPGVRVSRLVNAFANDGGKSMIVCGAGSAGVERSELPPDRGNHFGIYRIREGRRTAGASFVDVEWMELPYNDVATRWTSTGRWTVEG